VNINIARTHIREREQQRMRGERIIDVTVCVARALPVAPLAHLKARAGADDGERGGAATTAPTAGNAEHDLHD